MSNAGGTQAIWRRDGKELFYVNAEQHAGICADNSQSWKGRNWYGPPTVPCRQPYEQRWAYDPYDVARDGKSFVIITIPQQASKPITLVTNWMGDLKRQ